MNEPADPARTAELHALIDGELDPARAPELLGWLQEHPEEAARVAQWQAQRLQLRQLHRSLELGATPPALARTVLGSRRWRGWRLAAAAALLLGLGVAGGKLWTDATTAPTRLATAEPRFVRDALIAHAVYTPEKRHPVEVAADEEAHLVQWLSRRLGTPVKAPSLQAQGFRLMGGRLLPGPDAPRAQFMYEDALGRRVTLYISVFGAEMPLQPTAFRSVREGAFESFYWVDGRIGYALSAELPASEVLALAKSVYQTLPK